MTGSAVLSRAVCKVLDRLGSDDSTFNTEISLPDPATPDMRALENCLRNLASRFQSLQRKAENANQPPVAPQLMHIEEPKYVCSTCGHRLDTPLTPDETPVLLNGKAGPLPKRLDSSCSELDYLADGLVCEINGYESDSTNISVPSINPTPNAIVFTPEG